MSERSRNKAEGEKIPATVVIEPRERKTIEDAVARGKDSEYSRYSDEVLDLYGSYLLVDLDLLVDHEDMPNRIGEFRLSAVNTRTRKVIIDSWAKRGSPRDPEGQMQHPFSFIVDPMRYTQDVEIVFAPEGSKDAARLALLPALAGEDLG